ncbi:MAG: SsrA-binding protein SmpB [Candidatus Omnitrophota bacterium]
MDPKKIATNKKAFRDYFFSEKWECGLELKGSEVKSLRASEVSFTDSFARVEQGQVILYNLHIAPYQQGSYFNLEPTRPRRLLLHKKEIMRIETHMSQKGLALIPTRIYFNRRGLAKVELALGRGKKLFDKREDIKKRDVDREIKRAVRHQRKR